MFKQLILMVITLTCLIGLINSADFGYTNIETPEQTPQLQPPFNYTALNVTDAQFLRGLTPQEVADLYTETDPLSFHTGEDLDNSGYTITANLFAGLVGGLLVDGDPWYLSGTSLEIDEDLQVNNTVIENSLTIGGFVLSHLLPSPTLTLDLGSGANRWRWLYVQNISAENIDTYSLTASDNVTADYFIGDGSQLSNLPINSYNSTYAGLINNASYLSTYNATYHNALELDRNVGFGNCNCPAFAGYCILKIITYDHNIQNVAPYSHVHIWISNGNMSDAFFSASLTDGGDGYILATEENPDVQTFVSDADGEIDAHSAYPSDATVWYMVSYGGKVWSKPCSITGILP